jgi:hypothetical protein
MKKFQLGIAFLLSIGFTLTHYTYADVIWENKLDYIAIEQVTNVATRAQHSPPITQAQLVSALSSLAIKPKEKAGVLTSWVSDEDISSLFTEKEVKALTDNLLDPLQTLADNQVIVFSVSDSRSTFIGLGSETLYSSGTLYIDGNYLHVLLGEAHVDIQKKYIRAGNSVSNSRFASTAELKGFKLPTGDFTATSDHSWEFQLTAQITQVNHRPDWVKINMAHGLQEMDNTPTLATIPSSQTSLTFFTQQEETTEPPQSPREKRLATLKQLYLSGKIPEQVYLEKVNEIIADL